MSLAVCLAMAATAVNGSDLAFRWIGAEAGLPHHTVNAIVQDRDGFMWMGTSDGLVRADGVGFRRFRIPGSAEQAVVSLLVDHDNRLWVGSVRGLLTLDRARGTLTVVATGTTELKSRTPLLETPRGVMAGLGGTVVEVTADGLTRTTLSGARPGDQVVGLVTAGATTWAVMTAEDWTRPRLVALDVEAPEAAFDLTVDPSLTGFGAWVGSRGCLWLHLTRPRLRAPPGWCLATLVDPPDEPVLAYLEDPDHGVWLGTPAGLYRVGSDGSRAMAVELGGSRGGWQAHHVTALGRDDGGRLWVGTLGGVWIHDPGQVHFRTLGFDDNDPAGLAAAPVSAIAPAGGNLIWVGTYGGGLHLVDLERGVTVGRWRHDPADPSSLADDNLWSLATEPDGTLWIGAETGLSRRHPDDGRFEVVDLGLPAALTGSHRRVKDLAMSDDGGLWIGTNHGLIRIDAHGGRRRWQAGGPEPALGSSIVRRLLLSENRRTLWVAGTAGALDRLDVTTGRIEHLRIGDGSETLNDLLHARSGGLWVATTAGLARVAADGATLELVGDLELPGSVVFSVVEDAADRLWLGTNQGLVRVEPDGAATRVYDLADGIGSLEFNRHATHVTHDGVVVLGGMAGLTWFDPATIGADTRPARAVLSLITILGDGGERTLEPAAAPVLELGPHDRALTVEIAVPFFTRPDRCRVAHRLVGFEADWVDIGSRRSVRYTHLPAGRHLLEVRAANPDGRWGPVTVRLPLQIRPPVWQTWWFRLTAAAVVIALLILAYRLRVARLLALERVRLRIAGDLHDELGSDLSGIAIAAGMVARRPDLGDRDRHRLEEAGATAVRVMQSLRDVVWCVDPDHDSAEALVDRLRTTATTLFEGHQLELELEAHGELSMDVRRILLQSAKELMHNVVRHARASSVHIALRDTPRGIELEVADDGAGFDPKTAASGTGLRRIARRVEAVGGRLSVVAEPGRGARITIRAPRLSTSRSNG